MHRETGIYQKLSLTTGVGVLITLEEMRLEHCPQWFATRDSLKKAKVPEAWLLPSGKC